MKVCRLFILFLLPVLANAQTPLENLRKAYDMRSDARKFYKSDPARAEKMLAEANTIYQGYPPGTVGLDDHHDQLPKFRFDRGDIRGMNTAIGDALGRYYKMTEPLKPDNPTYRLVAMNAEHLLLCRAKENATFGDYSVMRNDVLKILELGIDKKDYELKYTSYSGMIGSASMKLLFPEFEYTAFLNEDAPLIENLQAAIREFDPKNHDALTVGTIYTAILAKDYDEAVRLAQDLQQTGANNRITGRFFEAWCYAIQKRTAESERVVSDMLKGIRVGPATVARIRALNFLNDKKYDEALEQIRLAMKPQRFLNLSAEQPGKFLFYTMRGDAYTGKKLFEKARADYETALLYASGYAPALNGLASLEVALAKEKQVDKAAPEIRISEPAAARGEKVTVSSPSLTVRGSAIDASGIRSVTANGQPLYTQADGTFWGAIDVPEGASSVKIAVTDHAGNTGEAQLEVIRVAAPATTAIVLPAAVTQARNYALIIAAQNYADPAIPSLENPVADAIKLKMVLKSGYGFADDNIMTLFNPVQDDVRKAIATLIDDIQPDDNLVVFYAGHGIWVDKEKKGYWLLTDALRNDPNTWFSNKAMLELLARFPARHTLLITDACFSGSVFRSRGLGADAPPALREMSEKISRVAITSGNDSEVPDESVFMKYLVKALNDNQEKYLTAQKMFITQIIEAVMAETKTEPRYGTLEAAGHIGGDFIFSKK